MRYPFINSRRRSALSIPDLLGGLNYRDGLSGVNDNQMTDGLNVYEKDGRLVTRCGYETIGSIPKDITETFPQGERTLYYGGHRVIGKYKDKVILAVSRGTDDEYAPVEHDYYYLVGESVGESGFSYLDKITTYFEGSLYAKYETIKDNYLYVVLSMGDTEATIYNNPSAYKLDLEAETPMFAETNIYIPTILVGYKETNGGIGYEATQFEGFSILTDKFIIRGQTINLDDSTHPGIYKLPYNLKIGSTLTVKTSGAKGATRWTNTHTLTVASSGVSREGPAGHPGDGKWLSLNANRDTITFYTTETGTTVYNFNAEWYFPDNMEIQGEREANTTSIELRQAVFDCQSQIWYGGTANGISSGSRLFLGGCSDTKYRNYIFWSGLNDATALLENCCAGVGDKSTGVTAFGQQGENLVIFKEASTHYTKTQYNNEITAESLVNQSIVDYSANAVYFPLIDINGEIGCDLPDTVQLCRNRLVWANKDGKIYTLANFNQFSQTNVYQCSEMIENETTRKSIVGGRAVAYENYYVLQYKLQSGADTVYDEICYLMYADSVGYNKITQYDTDTAQKQIAWYKWDIEGQLVNSIEYIKVGSANIEIYALGDNDYDANGEIQSIVKTKAFDFSAPYLRKFVESVNITLGNNGAKPIKVTFITDGGEFEDEVIPYSDETNGKDIGYFETYHLMPRLKGFCRVALKLESTGKIDVDRLNIIYRFLGGVK